MGAIIRGEQVIFPRGDDVLQAGDRAIIVADTKRVAELERRCDRDAGSAEAPARSSSTSAPR